MGLVARESESRSSFKPVPPGMHLARCYRIIDLGTQTSEYQGQVNKARKVMIQFEIHGEDEAGNALVTDRGEPLTISKNYSISLGEKASLRKDLSTWRGRDFTPEERKGFELTNILGHWAMLSVGKTIGNNGKEYTNILGINPVPASIKKAGLPEAHNEAKTFDIENPDLDFFDTFSIYLKEKIEASPEWKARQKTSSHPLGDDDDDLPF